MTADTVIGLAIFGLVFVALDYLIGSPHGDEDQDE